MYVRIQTMALGALFSLGLIGLTAVPAGAEPETKHKKSEQTVVKKADKALPKAPEPVVVTAVAGDTLESIATANETTYVRLFNANENITNPDMIDVGDEVKIPTPDEELPDRFGALAPVVAVVAQTATQPQTYAAQSYAPRGSSAGNTYAYGNCTWYVKNRRGDLPNMLGNGGSWAANASRQGIATGSAPRAGAVAEQPGHVAYVESVNSDGTVNISEMNYAGGFGRTSSRTVAASTFHYIY